MAPDDEQWPKTPEADAVRLGLFALVRQKGYEPLAAAVQDPSGRSSGWWPVAFALQRIERSARDSGAAAAGADARPLHARVRRARPGRAQGRRRRCRCFARCSSRRRATPSVSFSVVRALGADRRAGSGASRLIALLTAEKTDPNLRLEAVTALATLKSQAALPYVQELLTDDWPTMRAAAVRAAGRDRSGGLPHRALGHGARSVLGRARRDCRRAPHDARRGRDRPAARDARRPGQARRPRGDRRPGAAEGAGARTVLLAQLKAADIGIRAAAARAIGQLKPAGGPAALREAYRAAAGGFDATTCATPS